MTAQIEQVRSGLLTAVDDALARCAAETLTLPHVVWVFDRQTGEKCCLGPFVSPVDACVHAEQVVREIAGEGFGVANLEVEIIPLEAVPSGAAAGTGPSSGRSVYSRWWRFVGGVLQRRRGSSTSQRRIDGSFRYSA